jgi:hypothetical protein
MTLALGACQTLPEPASVRGSIANHAVNGHAIDGVPFVAQKPYGCGPAALESVAAHFGV